VLALILLLLLIRTQEDIVLPDYAADSAELELDGDLPAIYVRIRRVAGGIDSVPVVSEENAPCGVIMIPVLCSHGFEARPKTGKLKELR
jgi:hypothetical protein